MPTSKKKLHLQVIDKAKDWDEKMKKYKFYKEVIKDFLLMIPLLGSVGSFVLNWAYKSYVKYTKVATAARERVADSVETVVESYPAIEPATLGDFVRDFFIFWLVVIIAWRIYKKVKDKKRIRSKK